MILKMEMATKVASSGYCKTPSRHITEKHPTEIAEKSKHRRHLQPLENASVFSLFAPCFSLKSSASGETSAL